MFEYRGGCKIYLLLIADGGPRNVACNDLSLATRVHDICYMTSAIIWIKQVKSTTQSSHPLTLIARSIVGSHSVLPSTTSCRAPLVVRSVTLLLIKHNYRLSAESDMMLDAPAATDGNAGQSTQPAGMPMVADQTSPPRKLLRQNIG